MLSDSTLIRATSYALRNGSALTSGVRSTSKTVWPSGLRRWLQTPVRKGVGSNPTAVILTTAHDASNGRAFASCKF
jgi:hypothetical protein